MLTNFDYIDRQLEMYRMTQKIHYIPFGFKLSYK